MLNIWVHNLGHWQETDFAHLLKKLPENMQREICSIKYRETQWHRLVGRLLLKKALKHTQYAEQLIDNWTSGTNGKPYIPQWVEFNISHSKDYIVLVFGEQEPLGIDVEYLKKNINVVALKYFFCENERKYIEESLDKTHAFFELWTRKEAILKACGQGMSNELYLCDCSKNIVQYASQNWAIQKVQIVEEYVCHLAQNTQQQAFDLRYIQRVELSTV